MFRSAVVQKNTSSTPNLKEKNKTFREIFLKCEVLFPSLSCLECFPDYFRSILLLIFKPQRAQTENIQLEGKEGGKLETPGEREVKMSIAT